MVKNHISTQIEEIDLLTSGYGWYNFSPPYELIISTVDKTLGFYSWNPLKAQGDQSSFPYL